jgi:hypothetical protein
VALTYFSGQTNLGHRDYLPSQHKRGISRIKKKINGAPHHIFHNFLENKRKLYAQKYVFEFFGDHVDGKVSIVSDTVHAPESVACLVLLFADRIVGAVTEDIMVIRKNFGGREKCLEQKKEQFV